MTWAQTHLLAISTLPGFFVARSPADTRHTSGIVAQGTPIAIRGAPRTRLIGDCLQIVRTRSTGTTEQQWSVIKEHASMNFTIERLTAAQAADSIDELIELLRDGLEHGAWLGFVLPLQPDEAWR